jgi:translation initiation factor 1 (eIF-1/SUI1)
MVRLDAILCDALLSKAEYRTIDELPRDQLLTRLCSKMQPFHTIQLPEQKEPILRKGHPKPVEIVQEIRQGRKTVTKVTGVEAFGLDVDELVKEFTKLCASSVTCKDFFFSLSFFFTHFRCSCPYSWCQSQEPIVSNHDPGPTDQECDRSDAA